MRINDGKYCGMLNDIHDYYVEFHWHIWFKAYFDYLNIVLRIEKYFIN